MSAVSGPAGSDTFDSEAHAKLVVDAALRDIDTRATGARAKLDSLEHTDTAYREIARIAKNARAEVQDIYAHRFAGSIADEVMWARIYARRALRAVVAGATR